MLFYYITLYDFKNIKLPSIGLTIFTNPSLDPPVSIPIIIPEGVFKSLSISFSNTSSNASDYKYVSNFSFISILAKNSPIFLDKYLFKYSLSKKLLIIIRFIAYLISLNLLGITPDPYIKGTSSNNIFTANQFVIPPANPKTL